MAARTKWLMLLLVLLVLLPLSAQAQNEDLVVVLVANDAFASTSAEGNTAFFEALETLVAAAEAQGRTVEVRGPTGDNNASRFSYITGDGRENWDLRQVSASSRNTEFLNKTIASLNRVSLAGKDVLLLVGHLHDNEEAIATTDAALLSQAATLRVVAVSADLLNQTDGSTWNTAPMANTLHAKGVFAQLAIEPNIGVTGSWYLLSDKIFVHEYIASETMEQRLLSALYPPNRMGQVAAQQQEDGLAFPALKAHMQTPLLSLRTTGSWADVELVAPSGDHYRVSRTDVVQPLVSDTPALIGPVLPNAATMVVLPQDTDGTWRIISTNVESAMVSFEMVDVAYEAPFVLTTDATPWEGSADAGFTLNAVIAKHKPFALTANKTDELYTQLVSLYGENAVSVMAEATTPTGEKASLLKTQTGFELTPEVSGPYTISVSLLVSGRKQGTQTYTLNAENSAPTQIGGIEESAQGQYWELLPEHTQSFDLSTLFTDPDGDALKWTVSKNHMGVFTDELDLGGATVRINGSTLDLVYAEPSGDPQPWEFCVRAEDPEGYQCDRDIRLEWYSLRQDLSSMLLMDLRSDEALSPEQAKGAALNICFAFKDGSQVLKPALLSYLQQYATMHVDLLGTENGDLLSTEATWNEETQCYEALLTTPIQSGSYTLSIRLEVSSDAPIVHQQSYPMGTIAVNNRAPAANAEDTEETLFSFTLEPYKCLDNNAFTDPDLDDSLTYRISINCFSSPFDDRYSVVHEGLLAEALPYEFAPEAFGRWMVRIVAVDEEGAQSQAIMLRYTIYNTLHAIIAALIVIALLASLVLLIIHLLKPSFRSNDELRITLAKGGARCDRVLHPGSRKKKPMPLLCVLPEVSNLLLSRENCDMLSKLLVKPTRGGSTLVDQTRTGLLPNGDTKMKLIFGEPVTFSVGDLQLTITPSESQQ